MAAYKAAVAAHQQHDLDTALKKYQEVLRMNPNIAAVHNNVGVALEVQGQAEEALASYITAAELLDPDCFPFPECAEEHAVIFYNAARLLPTGAAARALGHVL
mgnify:CR=1 FL=1